MESSSEKKVESRSVLIVGAGRSGMLAARHLSQIPNIEITVIESQAEVGGLWVYDERSETHPRVDEEKKIDNYYKLNNCFQGSVYPHVITNMPNEFLSYKDFSVEDFNPKMPEFLTLTQYNSYLNAYWEKFDLKKYVIFNTLVKSVRLYDNLSQEQKQAVKGLPERTFVVTTIKAKSESLSQDEKVSTYDYVVVCTGMSAKPYVPAIKGVENFKGKVIHSKDFREPDEPIYKGKTILLLGGSYSGIDMIVQFFHNPVKGKQNVKKMIFCNQKTNILDDSTDFKDLLEEGTVVSKKGWVQEFTEDSVIYTDGTSEQVDVVMFCTGYAMKFPFFDPEDKLFEFGGEETRYKFFGPLYKRMFAVREPKLCFIGLIDFTGFINYIAEIQAMFFKHVVDGSLQLPSREEMMKEYESDVDKQKKNCQTGTLINFFKLAQFKYDLPYMESLRCMVKHLYPDGEEKQKKSYERSCIVLVKMTEFFSQGNLLQYKSFPFSKEFPKEIKNTTEFI